MFTYRFFIADLDQWFLVSKEFLKQTADIDIWFMVFENGEFSACYNGNIVDHNTREIMTLMRNHGVTSYERSYDRDTDCYEFSTNDFALGEAIIKKMTLLFRRNA